MIRTKRQECPECGSDAKVIVGDYLCIACRAAQAIHDFRLKEGPAQIVAMAYQLWPGWVMIRESDSWTEIRLVERDNSSQAFAMSITSREGYAIWSESSDVYRVGLDGAVEDDPLEEGEFLAILSAANESEFE